MARVVVTGGCGFLGSHLVDRLVRQGDQAVVFDRGTPSPDQEVAATYVKGDICDIRHLADVITKEIDIVYHLAAIVGVDRYVDRPLDVVDVNLLGTRNVLELAERAGVKVVVASTSEVFGKNPQVPWSEESDRVLGSTSIERWGYSTSKALAEHLTYAFIRQHGLTATIVRYFNIYGPRQRPAFIVSRSIHRALRGLRPVVYDAGGQTRAFTFVDDVVEATVLAGTSSKADGEAFNVGHRTECTIQKIVDLVIELTGTAPDVIPVDTRGHYGDSYQDLLRRLPDSTKAGKVLGWRSETGLREGIQRTVTWARANQWWLDLPDSGPE
ncbi:NAD-dependent epimerase/dehydratase family protein [Nonomuraea sp. 10N515B]|uniref:NAD-dependent epimerase/dehydratase family protein n=1 Tax=Nonomuraea sp. 10N515B TaxID=3457422 RepID=UPI003FCD26C2